MSDHADSSGPKHLNISLSRAKFEQLVGDLVERSLEPVRKAIKVVSSYRPYAVSPGSPARGQ